MGVPKFFKYISERYPCLSELIKEYQVPEFDNLYLDMNGIIHMCSHPDDSDAHFRITEEKIFQDIFHYIEILFRMIKPKKLFFMAVDGVAPRAKMNQQRGRRFRSAKEAEQLEAKAKAKGEKLPDEDRFDSNCITPGTPFMARLHEQLKYFVIRQISKDRLWQNCKVVLSGHDTPGEGEHKIMDYIRYMKSKPDYDPNTRHCLYGLDADLMMLGLCTHEPHFSLLREEVRFGRKAQRTSVPEQINFFLLHLSLLREYLEQEFIVLKEGLPFEYDMEKIIDDWVLMGFLVGNDFIPNLPNLHISNGALPILYNAYMKVLPTLGGYINEAGSLNLKRFEKFMAALATIDLENFTETHADLKYFEGKTGRKLGATERTSYKPDGPDVVDAAVEVLEKKKAPMSADLAALIKSTDELFLEDPPDVWESELSPDEPSTPDNILSESEDDDDLFVAEFIQHKKDYYMNKLDYSKVTAEVLQSQAEGYVRAIQWNLNYYYNGVCSWSWFYPHHYAPYISDIIGFSDLKLEFDLGKPFLPFQQLLAVLPSASKRLLPEPYQKLMISDESPIVDYYPQEFRTDLNGKRQEWEAVVLIPFIDEDSLLKAMEPLTKELTPDEIQRNTHGPMHQFEYYELGMGIYRAPDHFQNIKDHHALITPITMEEIRVPREKLVKGLCPGVKLDVYFPGFPTMKHLKYTSHLQKARVKVFEQPSRGESVILQIISSNEKPNIEKLANDLIGKIIFVSWPHLVEAKVISVSNREYRYTESKSDEKGFKIDDNKGPLATQYFMSKNSITESYKTRLGIEIGETEIVINAALMMGRKYVFDPSGGVTLEKQWCETTSAFALQACVTNLNVHVSSYTHYETIQDVFSPFGTVFMLGIPHYGCMGEVINNNIPEKPGRVKVAMTVIPEPDLSPLMDLERELRVQYMHGGVAAQKLAISSHLLSRITGSIFVISGPKIEMIPDGVNKTNIGLNLKFNKRNEEIPGYTRKEVNTWLYSMKAVNLIKDFMQLCPELFDYLGRNVSNDIFFEGEIYPTDANGENIKKIAAWLKEQPYSSLERQTVGTKTLEPELITHLERIVDDHYASILKGKTVTMTVKPHVLFKPELHISAILPDPTTTYHLYDRVVNVRDSYTVPLGHKGTIVAIHEPKGLPSDNQSEKSRDISYDVVFDQPFSGGMTLNCAPNRAYRMCAMNLLNISHGLRTEQMKTTGGPVQIQQQQQSRYRNTGGRNNQSAFASWNTSATRPLVPTYGLRPDPVQRSSIVEQKNALNQDAAPVQVLKKNDLPMAFTRHAGPPIRSQPKPATAEFEAMWDELHKKKDATKSEDSEERIGSAGTSEENKSDKPSEALIDLEDFLEQSTSDKSQPSTNQKNSDSNKTQQSDNVQNSTDLLKMMLKISADSEKQSSSDTSNVSSVQDFFQRAKETTTVSASLRLLNMFQSRGLGIPRYSYVPCPGPLVRAQISLPDGRIVMGAPAATNEQASEIAATLVLAELNKMGPPSSAVNTSELLRLGPPMMQSPLRLGQPLSTHQIRQMGPHHLMQGAPLYQPPHRQSMQQQPPNRQPMQQQPPNRQPMQQQPPNRQPMQQPGMLPAPPQNWYQQNSQFGLPLFMPQFQQAPNHGKRHNAQPKPQDSNKQSVAPSAAQGASPFVPLQAVKQHRNKNNTNKADTSKNTSNSDSPKKAEKVKSSAQTANDSMSQSDKTSNDTSSDQPKKPIVKKVRKSRIAANFGGQKQ